MNNAGTSLFHLIYFTSSMQCSFLLYAAPVPTRETRHNNTFLVYGTLTYIVRSFSLTEPIFRFGAAPHTSSALSQLLSSARNNKSSLLTYARMQHVSLLIEDAHARHVRSLCTWHTRHKSCAKHAQNMCKTLQWSEIITRPANSHIWQRADRRFSADSSRAPACSASSPKRSIRPTKSSRMQLAQHGGECSSTQ